jgi:hypothetical protein
MREYRCYFLNRRGNIGDVVEFVSSDDEAARCAARGHFERQNDFPGFEIWEQTRLVHREPSEKAAARG